MKNLKNATIIFLFVLFEYLFIDPLLAQAMNGDQGYKKVLIVREVIGASPAEQAGLRRYDIIYSLDNKVFYETNSSDIGKDFITLVNSLPLGKYELVVLRGDQKVKLTVQLPEKAQSARLGILLEAIENDPQIYFDLAVSRLKTSKTREDLKAVAENFEKAKALSPEWEDVYYNLGLIYDKLDYYDKAVENYLEHLKLLTHRSAPFEESEKTAILLGRAKKNYEKLKEVKEKMVNGVWFYPPIAEGRTAVIVTKDGRRSGIKVRPSNVAFVHKEEIPPIYVYKIGSEYFGMGRSGIFYPRFKFSSDGKMWQRNIAEEKIPEEVSNLKEMRFAIQHWEKSIQRLPWVEVVWDGGFFEIKQFLATFHRDPEPGYLVTFCLFKGEVHLGSEPIFLTVREYENREWGNSDFNRAFEIFIDKLKRLKDKDFKFFKEHRFILEK